MDAQGWTVFGRYLLFQIPGWVMAAIVAFGLWHWQIFSWQVVLALYGVWILKDFVLYPLLRHAYEPGGKSGAQLLIGMEAIAQKRLDPDGQVLVRGERWRARAEPGEAPIPEGTPVRVSGYRGLTLFVKQDRPGSGP